MPLLSGALAFGYQPGDAVVDPADVLGHLRVDTVLPPASAALAPAHDARHKVGVAVVGYVRPSAVTLAGVLRYVVIAGAEHAGGDAQRGGFHAGLPVHVGNREALQNRGCWPVLVEATEAADLSVPLLHQHL